MFLATSLGVPGIDADSAARLVRLIKLHAGIDLSAQKTDLLRNRLGPRLRALDLPDFAAYLRLLEGTSAGPEIPRLVEAITTHTTSFFREERHFHWLVETGLPSLVEAGDRELVVWSAACSTGAEVWSAAMTLEDFTARRGRPLAWRAIGTDISRPILARAEAAIYSEEEIEGIPEAMRRLHLLRSLPGRAGPSAGRLYRIRQELRARTRFLQANLFALDRAPRIEADIAFLRNVLIYFDKKDQARVAAAVAARIRPGGFLLTGHAEALFAPPADLVAVASSIYRKVR